MDEDNVTKVNASVCSYAKCGQPAVKICPSCGQDFCENHECLMHSKVLETAREPVLDEDGAPRHGTRIKLIGEGWPDRIQKVDDMSDEQLVEFIAEHQRRLTRAQKEIDYEQITIAHASYILGHRQHSRYVAAVKRRKRQEEAAAGIINLGVKKAKAAKQVPADIASLMKQFNLSFKDASNMKILLEAMKKAKGGT